METTLAFIRTLDIFAVLMEEVERAMSSHHDSIAKLGTKVPALATRIKVRQK